MKIVLLITGVSLIIFFLILLKFLYIDLPHRRLEYSKFLSELEVISAESVSILNQEKTIQKISKHDIVLKNCGSPIDCQNIKSRYIDFTKYIVEGISFYRCKSSIGDLFVREEKKKFLENYIFSYQAYSSSPGKIQLTGVSFSKNSDIWLEYDQYFDLGKYDPCYPWNDLESYWKIYGKATPEEIQAVIDESNNSH